MVPGRQVRHLHPLGRLFGAGVCAAAHQGRDALRRVVLALADRGQEGHGAGPGRLPDLAVSPARLRGRFSLLRFRAAVSRRDVRPGPLGGRVRALRRPLRGADLETPRGLYVVAQRGSQPRLGTALERGGHRPAARRAGRSRQGGAQARAPHGHLLFALRVVQPAVAFR